MNAKKYSLLLLEISSMKKSLFNLEMLLLDEGDEKEIIPKEIKKKRLSSSTNTTFPLFEKSLISQLVFTPKEGIPSTKLDWINEAVKKISLDLPISPAEGVAFIWSEESTLNGTLDAHARISHRYDKHIVSIISTLSGKGFYSQFNKENHTRGISSSNQKKISTLVESLSDIAKYIVLIDLVKQEELSSSSSIPEYTVYSHSGK